MIQINDSELWTPNLNSRQATMLTAALSGSQNQSYPYSENRMNQETQ